MTLRRPLREVLDARTTEHEILGVWRRVQEKRRARHRRGPAVLAALCTAALLVAILVGRTLLGSHAGEAETPGPLAAIHGSSERPLSGGAELVQSTALSDGSNVVMRPGARLAVLENSGHAFVTHLSSGHADFSVKPGGPRRWVVECGPATIEVVGTEFTLERSPDELLVDVKHGVVLVRGEVVPDRIRRLVAGESLRLEIVAAPAPAASAAPVDSPALLVPPAESASTGVAVPKPAESSELPGQLDPTAALYAEADRARRTGHASEAAELLEKAVASEAHGHRAAIACFTLGRLYLDELGKPGAGARAFERSLLAGPPRGLEEDVRARLVEARAKMGDSIGAERAASEYRARFPKGRRAAEVGRWSPGE
jgi:transmembrane sensor